MMKQHASQDTVILITFLLEFPGNALHAIKLVFELVQSYLLSETRKHGLTHIYSSAYFDERS